MSISTTAKQGNVLVLLDLYTSGFVSAVSPTIPMLTSRTMQTLYAISLLVYMTASFFNWIHVYCLLEGYTTSFPLQLWFAVAMVAAVVAASMLTILLLMLCIENAFIHRLDITVYKSGLWVIWEAFVEWIHSFNNFRVAFLFMVLHDAPVTLANFFLVAPCRFAGPDVLHWPLFASTLSTLICAIWRLIMLYHAYSRLVLAEHRRTSQISSRQQSIRTHHFELNPAESQRSRLDEFDETWPVRWGITRVYGHYPTQCRPKTIYLNESGFQQTRTFWNYCTCFFSFLFLKISDLAWSLCQKVACLLCIIGAYFSCAAVCCLPCIHYYTCKSNSLSHRHKASKTFVRCCTYAFHYAILFFSVVCTLTLIVLNLIMISSVHVIGWNNVPTEINKICIVVDYENRIIQPFLIPSDPESFFSNTNNNSTMGTASVQNLPNNWYNNGNSRRNMFESGGRGGTNSDIFCKPLWQSTSGGYHDKSLWNRLGINREPSGPWQLRIPLKQDKSSNIGSKHVSSHHHIPSLGHQPITTTQQILAISTYLVTNFASSEENQEQRRRNPSHTLYFDYALFETANSHEYGKGIGAGKGETQTLKIACRRKSHSGWSFVKTLNKLGFPYFISCSSTLKVRKGSLIRCDQQKK